MAVFAVSGTLKIDLRKHIGPWWVEMKREKIPGGVNIGAKQNLEAIAVFKKECSWGPYVLLGARRTKTRKELGAKFDYIYRHLYVYIF